VTKAGLGETAITLKDDPSGETVRRLRKRLSALAGVLETDYHFLTKKLVVKYDPEALTASQIIREVGALHGRKSSPL
jgi:hypothetical protein